MVPITRTQTHQVIVGAHPGSHVQGQSSRKLPLGRELDGVGAGVLGSHGRELLPDTLPDLRILWKERLRAFESKSCGNVKFLPITPFWFIF